MSIPAPHVFVHGLFGSFREQQTFQQLTPAACSAPDLLGYGANAGCRGITTAAQVQTLADHIEAQHGKVPVRLVAHSIGAVYAFEYAAAFPDRVHSIESVEGNFTLEDAFWSRSIAMMGAAEAEETITARLRDPIGLLQSDGIEPTHEHVDRAREALACQPWETAAAIVATTGDASYLETVRQVLTQTPVDLVAGERPVSGWDVPDWATAAARTSVILEGVGHMMMLERPAAFGQLLGSLEHE
jgi:lipase